MPQPAQGSITSGVSDSAPDLDSSLNEFGDDSIAPSISVVILSYNHPEITERCVRSVDEFCQKNSKSADAIHVNKILVHNGSDQKNTDSLKRRFNDWRHLVILENKGFSGGANVGLNAGFEGSDWVMFLTNDCELESLSIPNRPGFFAVPIRLRKTAKFDSLGGIFNPSRAKLRHCWSLAEVKPSPGEFFYVPGTAFVIHRNSWNETDGFDEKLGTYWEDVDFSVQAQQRGIAVGLHPDCEVRHAVGKTCHKNPLYSVYLFQRNRRKVSLKYSRGSRKFMTLFCLLSSHIRLAIKLMKAGRFNDLGLLVKTWA